MKQSEIIDRIKSGWELHCRMYRNGYTDDFLLSTYQITVPPVTVGGQIVDEGGLKTMSNIEWLKKGQSAGVIASLSRGFGLQTRVDDGGGIVTTIYTWQIE